MEAPPLTRTEQAARLSSRLRCAYAAGGLLVLGTALGVPDIHLELFSQPGTSVRGVRGAWEVWQDALERDEWRQVAVLGLAIGHRLACPCGRHHARRQAPPLLARPGTFRSQARRVAVSCSQRIAPVLA